MKFASFNEERYVSSPEEIQYSCTGCVAYGESTATGTRCWTLNRSAGNEGCNSIIWKKLEAPIEYKLMKDKSHVVPLQEDKSHVVPLEEQLPGTKYDSDKLDYTLIPPHALQELARNLTEGLKKYRERDNWKKVPEAQTRYLKALYRHLEAHRRGEIYDSESSAPNMPHMAAVAVNAMFLLEFMLDPNLKENKE